VSLALAGGLVGLGIAALGVAGFHRFGPRSLPRAAEVAVNARVVLAGVALSLAVGVVIGLVPAIRSSGSDLLANLRSSLRGMSLQGTRLRSALAATQLALALVLGIGAGLLFRSFAELRTEQLGFTPRRLVACSVAFKAQRPWEMWDQVLEAVRAVPGVTGAAGASSLPFQIPSWEPRVQQAEQIEEMSTAPIPGYAVTPGFFAVAGIQILQGRPFDGSDQPDSRPVAIVNQTLAKTALANRPAIGARLRVFDGNGPGREVEVVGVAGDVVQTRVEDGIKPALYVPHTQLPAFMNVLVATDRDLNGLGMDMRRKLAGAGLATAPLIGLESMEARIEATRAGHRFQALLIGAFAGVALLLSAIGLYGTLAFTVRSRTKELGIRMAIGAGQRQVFGLVLKQGFAVVGVGLAAGLVGALGLTRLLQGFLYHVSPIDPLAFLVTTVIVAASVLLAALRPARRASKIDPMSSIRVEG
jgi:predicted permease